MTGYTVVPFIGSVAQTPRVFHSAARTATVKGLTNGETYTFEVAAANASGTGPRSDPSSTVVVGTPTAPTDVVAFSRRKAVALSWHAPTSTNGRPVTGYVVTPFVDDRAQDDHVFDSVATSQKITDLRTGLQSQL